MGGKDDPGIGIWMACMNSCKAFVADSEDEVNSFYSRWGKIHSACYTFCSGF